MPQPIAYSSIFVKAHDCKFCQALRAFSSVVQYSKRVLKYISVNVTVARLSFKRDSNFNCAKTILHKVLANSIPFELFSANLLLTAIIARRSLQANNKFLNNNASFKHLTQPDNVTSMAKGVLCHVLEAARLLGNT